MKKILLFAVIVSCLSFTEWEPSFENAKKTAAENHELILLNFSGSDWCGPCIRMKKEIFSSDAFSDMAKENLVMVNADFPRSSKNQPDKKTVAQNEKLADKYNPNGNFPFTLLLDEKGNVLKAWDGFPTAGADGFIQEIKAISDDNKTK